MTGLDRHPDRGTFRPFLDVVSLAEAVATTRVAEFRLAGGTLTRGRIVARGGDWVELTEPEGHSSLIALHAVLALRPDQLQRATPPLGHSFATQIERRASGRRATVALIDGTVGTLARITEVGDDILTALDAERRIFVFALRSLALVRLARLDHPPAPR